MSQSASLDETIAKGKRHYYDGLSFGKWKRAMLGLYGHDTRPFLDQAWDAIIGEEQSRARANRDSQATNGVGADARANAKHRGPITVLGDTTMVMLNGIACLALFSAWRSGPPYSFDMKSTWVCFVAFSYAALWRMKKGAAFVCLPFACVFNPFYRIHLTSGLWNVVDVLSFLLLVAISFSFLANPKK